MFALCLELHFFPKELLKDGREHLTLSYSYLILLLLGFAAPAAAPTTESQPATVCVGASNNQLATSTVHHLTDAAGAAG